MKMSMLAIGIIALLAVAMIAKSFATRGGRGRGEAIKRKALLTKNEQPMYWRLVEAFPSPSYVVLAQVSFSAMLKATQTGTRNRFDRKIADFVVVDRSFTVATVIELDDKSHESKGDSDASRDAMLKEAGYAVIRYKTVPSVETLRADLGSVATTRNEPDENRRIEPRL